MEAKRTEMMRIDRRRKCTDQTEVLGPEKEWRGVVMIRRAEQWKSSESHGTALSYYLGETHSRKPGQWRDT